MRNGTASVTGTGVIFTGSGAVPDWFGTGGNPTSHRREQALFFVNNTQSVSLTDSAAVYLAGQLGHAASGGTFTFDHFLMQRVTSGGEFTGSTWNVNDSAFIECPDDSVNFINGDHDALYFVSGRQAFTNTLLGWTKDDIIDSGGSGYGHPLLPILLVRRRRARGQLALRVQTRFPARHGFSRVRTGL
jgi:hypothetical protein